MLLNTRTKGITPVGVFELHHGGRVENAHVAWRLIGDCENPLVIALGGISAGRDVNVWWKDFVGEGKAIDTRSFAVLGIDFLGGSGASTAPVDDYFPAVSSYDQARAIAHVLDDIGVERAHAFVGSSYGGMVALAFGESFPQRVAQLVVISAAHEPHPMATALRSLQRRAIALGLETGRKHEGIAIARGIAMTTYRTAQEFDARFEATGAIRDGRGRFAVEEYIEHCGATYARDFSPYGFLCLSESIDLHTVTPERIDVPTTLVAVDSDTLVPAWLIERTRQRLRGSKLVAIASQYGHDAFLKEIETVSQIVAAAIGGSR